MMNTTTNQLYDDLKSELWVLFDHRSRGGITRLWRERHAWGAGATIENFGCGRAVLIIKSGGAVREMA